MIISLVWKSEILSIEAAKSEGLRGKILFQVSIHYVMAI